MYLIAYTWLIIYARISLTHLYISCFICLLLLRESYNCNCIGKAQRGSTSTVRNKVRFYIHLVLYLLTALVYWEILIFGDILSVVVPLSHRKLLSITSLYDVHKKEEIVLHYAFHTFRLNICVGPLFQQNDPYY